MPFNGLAPPTAPAWDRSPNERPPLLKVDVARRRRLGQRATVAIRPRKAYLAQTSRGDLP